MSDLQSGLQIQICKFTSQVHIALDLAEIGNLKLLLAEFIIIRPAKIGRSPVDDKMTIEILSSELLELSFEWAAKKTTLY